MWGYIRICICIYIYIHDIEFNLGFRVQCPVTERGCQLRSDIVALLW